MIRQGGSEGFTTVEAVVALAIVGLVFAALLEGISIGLRSLDRANWQARAGLEAASVLARIAEGEVPLSGEATGGAGTLPPGVSVKLTPHSHLDRGRWVTVRIERPGTRDSYSVTTLQFVARQ